MRIILQQDLENLKTAILSKADIKALTPADCRHLANGISKATGKRISDTTLKRIFGFAASMFQPSLYTLNVLSEYCGFSSWQSFSQRLSSPSADDGDQREAATSLQAQVDQITLNTLQALKNRSVVPFQLTVEREFISEHLDNFFATSLPVTVFTAPVGYGKTVGLCHWVEQRIIENRNNSSNESILLLSSSVLNKHTYHENLYAWFLTLMGLEPSLKTVPGLENANIIEKPFILIIDGFDYIPGKSEQFDTLLTLLHDVVAISGQNPLFKVILTMRAATWIFMKKRLAIDGWLDNYYLGDMRGDLQDLNVSLFTESELNTLCSKIRPLSTPAEFKYDVASLFCYPLFFQYFYQKNTSQFCLAELDHFDIYEIVSSYIFDKVYTSTLSTEKVLLIRTFLDSGQFDGDRFYIKKLDVYEQIKVFKNAYEDLVGIGFIREINASTEKGYSEYIEFVHKRILCLCFARNLVYNNDGHYNEKLVHAISTRFNDHYRLPVLKACVFQAVKNGNTDIFNYLPLIPLSAVEKGSFINFLSDIFQKQHLMPGAFAKMVPQANIDRPAIFNYLLGYEFLSAEYKQALQGMVKLNLPEAQRILVYTCLAMNSLVQLDDKGVEDSLVALKRFTPAAYQSFQINPLTCVEALYQFLKTGKVDKRALKDITAFAFNPPKHNSNEAGSHYVLYVLALATLLISGNPKKVLRFISVLQNIHNSSTHYCPQFLFFLLTISADAYIALNQITDAIEVVNTLNNAHKGNNPGFTPYMKACLDYMETRLLYINQADNATAVTEAQLEQYHNSEYRLVSVNILAYCLVMNKHDKDSPYYSYLLSSFKDQLLRTAFNPKSFVFNYAELSAEPITELALI